MVTAADIRDFATWRYEAPLDVHNITQTIEEAVECSLQSPTGCHVILVGFARETSDVELLRVTFDAENQAALRVWPAAGFVETQRFHSHEVVLGRDIFVVLAGGWVACSLEILPCPGDRRTGRRFIP